MIDYLINPHSHDHAAMIERPHILQWVWRPWYAKLWWVLIATYWTIGVGALWLRPLAEFYTSRHGSLLHIAFFPVLAFVILSIGWLRAWIHALDYAENHPEVQNNLGWSWSADAYEACKHRWAEFDAPTNINSPMSGMMFVGNPENPSRRHYHH